MQFPSEKYHPAIKVLPSHFLSQIPQTQLNYPFTNAYKRLQTFTNTYIRLQTFNNRLIVLAQHTFAKKNLIMERPIFIANEYYVIQNHGNASENIFKQEKDFQYFRHYLEVYMQDHWLLVGW